MCSQSTLSFDTTLLGELSSWFMPKHKNSEKWRYKAFALQQWYADDTFLYIDGDNGQYRAGKLSLIK